MIDRTTQALIEETLPINPPTTPQIIAYITHKMVEIMRHHLYFLKVRILQEGTTITIQRQSKNARKARLR